MLSDEERASLSLARLSDNPTPVPTRVVSPSNLRYGFVVPS